VRLDQIPIGVNPPHDVNVVVECPLGGEPIKYEIDKASGALFVDRILHTPMRYPVNYGFIPHTLAEDGDPIDALIVARSPFIPGSIARVRPVGVLMMTDDGGGDAKLLCVNVNKVYPYYSNVQEHTRCEGWQGRSVAERLILESIDRAKAAEKPQPKAKPGDPRE
jgi:inorganic pyrophosphatase